MGLCNAKGYTAKEANREPTLRELEWRMKAAMLDNDTIRSPSSKSWQEKVITTPRLEDNMDTLDSDRLLVQNRWTERGTPIQRSDLFIQFKERPFGFDVGLDPSQRYIMVAAIELESQKLNFLKHGMIIVSINGKEVFKNKTVQEMVGLIAAAECPLTLGFREGHIETVKLVD